MLLTNQKASNHQNTPPGVYWKPAIIENNTKSSVPQLRFDILVKTRSANERYARILMVTTAPAICGASP